MNKSQQNQSTRRKTIYDGIRITRRGTDITIVILSVALALLLIFAVFRS